MKPVLIFFLVGLVFVLSPGCENNDPGDNNRKLLGTGPIVSKTLSLDEFSMIENTGVADIHISQGNPQTVVLNAQQNIIDVMTIGVLGDELKIGMEKGVSIKNADTIRFDITIPEVTSVSLIGVGDYILSGDFQEELRIVIQGVGNVRAFDQEVGTCSIFITGFGDCEVNVKDELIVDLTGVGKIYYKGHPNIDSSISGVGSLIDAN